MPKVNIFSSAGTHSDEIKSQTTAQGVTQLICHLGNTKSQSHSVSSPLSMVMQQMYLCHSLLNKNSNFAHFLVQPNI